MSPQNVQIRDCDHITPYLSKTSAQPLFQQEGSDTRGTRLALCQRPAVTTEEWAKLRNFSKEARHL